MKKLIAVIAAIAFVFPLFAFGQTVGTTPVCSDISQRCLDALINQLITTLMAKIQELERQLAIVQSQQNSSTTQTSTTDLSQIQNQIGQILATSTTSSSEELGSSGAPKTPTYIPQVSSNSSISYNLQMLIANCMSQPAPMNGGVWWLCPNLDGTFISSTPTITYDVIPIPIPGGGTVPLNRQNTYVHRLMWIVMGCVPDPRLIMPPDYYNITRFVVSNNSGVLNIVVTPSLPTSSTCTIPMLSSNNPANESNISGATINVRIQVQ
jgi:hypothetical protein